MYSLENVVLLSKAMWEVFIRCRDKGEIHPLSLSILKCGSFDSLLQVTIENGAAASQYKPPKIIRNRVIVDVMKGYVIVTKLRISLCLMACSPLILKEHRFVPS